MSHYKEVKTVEVITKEWLEKQKGRERRCARTLKGRALLCIDHILSNIGSEDPLLSKFYRLAHCATGVCLNPHEDWVDEVNQTYKQLIEGK